MTRYIKYLSPTEMPRRFDPILFLIFNRTTLCYKCQTWILTTNHMRKLTTTEMRCVRRSVRVSIRNIQRNESLRKRQGIESVLQYIKSRKLHWLGHLKRMSVNSLKHGIYTQLTGGYWPRGRQKKKDGVTTLEILYVNKT